MSSAQNPPRQLTPVLIVDDTESNLLAMSALLEPLGIELVTARSGREAIELCARRAFAVALLDVMMPGLDGIATLAAIRELPGARTMPVLLLTAYDSDGHAIRRAYALGAVDFLAKPIDPDILRAKVRTFIALYEHAETIRQLAASLAAKDRHISVLAHDLRAPLSVIDMSAQLLARHQDTAVRQAAQRVRRSSARMLQLTNDVLDCARASADKLLSSRTRADLVRICAELLDDFEATYPRTRFERSLPEDASGLWDKARMQQAITNLLMNAVDYGDGWVALTLEATSGYVMVRVENGGPPIPEERIPTLFEPFERGTDVRGTGLGLTIVREIARAHGGDVEARSEQGRTTFCLSLPRQAENEGDLLTEDYSPDPRV